MKLINRDIRWRYRRPAGVLCMLFLLMAFPVAAGGADAALRIGTMVPSVVISGVNGAPVRIPEDLSGKVFALHFWQIGCSSCKLEIPAMDILYKKYQRKGLEILAVNIGQKKEVVRSFVPELGVTYPILIDPEEKASRLFGVTDVPRTYVIDRRGVVRYRIFGGVAPEMLKKLILSLL